MHKKAWFLIAFGTGIFMRCWALTEGRGSARLNLSAAEVPCKTAPFASFSVRPEKEGPARPERDPISSSVVKASKKGRGNAEILRHGFCAFYATISLFRQAEAVIVQGNIDRARIVINRFQHVRFDRYTI
ncbi:MAG: hypothetical protein SPF51_10435 [Candidatus Fimivicinus sp.]|nr:hypothetical protein [Candidatus Fimivicinus sp.]